MILSSFGFWGKVDFVLYLLQSDGHFLKKPIFSFMCLVVSFDGFCARALELPAPRE